MAKMKTVIINGVPYRMRGDMRIPGWKRSAGSRVGVGNWARETDPFRAGHAHYLTTPGACEKKREREGDGCCRDARYEVVEEQIDLF